MLPPEFWITPLLAAPLSFTFLLLWWEHHAAVQAARKSRGTGQPTRTPAETRQALRRGYGGGALLLTVVGAAVALSLAPGGQPVDAQQRQYQTGVAALERGDWTAAQAALRAAGDYPGARQKLRDSYLGEASVEVQRERWKSAARAIVEYDRLSLARDEALVRMIRTQPRLQGALAASEPSFGQSGSLSYVGELVTLAPARALAYGPTEHQLLVATAAGSAGAVEQWDLLTPAREQILAASQERDFSPQQAPPLAVELSRDHKHILLSPGAGDPARGSITLWEVGDATPRLRLAGALARFSPGGNQLAGLDQQGRLTVWRANDGEVLAQTSLSGAKVTGIAWGPQAQSLLVVGANGGISRWAMPGLAAPESLAVSGTLLATGESGRLLAIATERAVTVVDLQSGATVLEASAAGPVVALTFSPDGELLALGANTRGTESASGGSVELWDVSAGEQVAGIGRLSDGVAALAFSPDGRTLVVASDGARVSFWRP